MRIVGEGEQREILGRDHAVGERARRTHSSSGVQYASPISTTGKCITLPVWISVSDSNSSSAVPNPPGKTQKPSAAFTNIVLRA